MSRKGDIKRFVSRLRDLHARTFNDLFTYQQLYQTATEMNIRCENFGDFLEQLNHQNFLLKKGPRVYRLANIS